MTSIAIKHHMGKWNIKVCPPCGTIWVVVTETRKKYERGSSKEVLASSQENTHKIKYLNNSMYLRVFSMNIYYIITHPLLNGAPTRISTPHI